MKRNDFACPGPCTSHLQRVASGATSHPSAVNFHWRRVSPEVHRTRGCCHFLSLCMIPRVKIVIQAGAYVIRFGQLFMEIGLNFFLQENAKSRFSGLQLPGLDYATQFRNLFHSAAGHTFAFLTNKHMSSRCIVAGVMEPSSHRSNATSPEFHVVPNKSLYGTRCRQQWHLLVFSCPSHSTSVQTA